MSTPEESFCLASLQYFQQTAFAGKQLHLSVCNFTRSCQAHMQVGFKKSCKTKDITHPGFLKKCGQTTLTLINNKFQCILRPHTATFASAHSFRSTTIPVPHTRMKDCVQHAVYVRSLQRLGLEELPHAEVHIVTCHQVSLSQFKGYQGYTCLCRLP